MGKKSIVSLIIIAGCFAISFMNGGSGKNTSPETANRYMWEQLHQGNYDNIPKLLEKLKSAWYEHPEDAKITAHLGFVYLWQFSERGRKKPDSAIVQNVYLSNYFFKKALELNPNDARLYGFQAATEVCEGAVAGKPAQILKGYAKGLAAIKKWPQFNRFALSFMESQMDTASPFYQQAMRFQWELLDECSCRELEQGKVLESPKEVFSSLMQELEASEDAKVKRACWNSWIAPHNFEGFLLNFGDMLVKQGKRDEALKIYSAAKLAPSYKEWVYKDVLEKRIRDIAINEKIFNREMQLIFPKNETQLFINSPFSCVACHQMSKAEYRRYGYQEPGEEIYFTVAND
jgi:hypothetical protein